MDKSQIIEKVAGHFGVQDSEQKLFFEIFLKKCSENLDAGESIQVGEIGRFEYRRAPNKESRDTIAVISGEDEFLFDIPEEDKEDQSIDSYFSISIGKPVIPLRGDDDSEFFIPHSGNEIKRMFELKVSRFIEDATKQQTEIEPEESGLDFSDSIPDVNFSFNNWKSSSDSDKEIADEIEEKPTENDLSQDQIEKDTLPEETNVENSIEEKTVRDFAEEDLNEISEKGVTKLEEVTPEIEEVPRAVENITEEIKDEELNAGVEPESSEESETEQQIEKEELEVSNESFGEEILPETDSASVPVEENIDDKQMVMDAVKSADEKDARLKSYKKKSYGGFIFAVVLLVIIGVVIYFSYYLTNSNKAVVQKTEIAKQFAVTIERTYNIPVTYPYEKGMLAEPYNAISISILNKSGKEEIVPAKNNNESISSGNESSGKVEIRKPLPATRVKGYIYKYENMYVVQVSSWKTKSIALSQAQKFLDDGYNAFIEQTELNDKGVYYRVRVGGFNSLEEAENFLKK